MQGLGGLALGIAFRLQWLVRIDFLLQLKAILDSDLIPLKLSCRIAWAKCLQHCPQWTVLDMWFLFFVSKGITTTSYNEPGGCWGYNWFHYISYVVLVMECFYSRCISILFVC
ncbi:uncharacterized protein DS421_16g553840 [Arachis hypogaea]|nr:uncharacterized protein DS421_16g553840 [Arachis hypogaea]